MIERAKTWARAVKTDIVALYIAAKDPRTPSLAKFISIAVVAYALSPIDLIPDFIPVLGYVDDLLIVPLGILLAIRLIPPTLMGEFRSRASDHERLPKSQAGAMVVILIWMAGTGVAGWWIFHRI
ncbi:MAG: YkvA family protein [Ahrensia sp.]|nr:YkvA family protein [Ahrensia sp.]